MNILDSKPQLKQKIQNAPTSPGCYIYFDKDGNRIYIGKAKRLINRVKSYFLNYAKLDIQKQLMIDTAVDINFIEVDSEFEALILENNLIKKYHPKFNIMLRDDKNYIFVRFEKIRRKSDPLPTAYSVYQDFPRIKVVREKKEDGAEYFGPFPSTLPVKRLLKVLRKVFPYRIDNGLVYQESDNPLKIFTNIKKPDLYYHIGLSKGTEAGMEDKKTYQERYNELRKYFRGEKIQIINSLKREIDKAVKKLDFEGAAKIRDRLNDIKYVSSHISLDSDIDDVLVTDLKVAERNSAIEHLIESLGFPDEKLKNHDNFRVECYDISNIQGTNAVGSMVVMIDGVATPRLYRKFKIKMKNEPNDFAMMQEVLARRFKQFLRSHLENEELLPEDLRNRAAKWKVDESFSQKPDLIIVDGGKGQLASVYKILYNFGLHNEIPVVGLAKREEEIFKISNQFYDEYTNQINDSDMFKRIVLSKRSPSLQAIQRLRDEAHRFAITYHRKLRSKGMVT